MLDFKSFTQNIFISWKKQGIICVNNVQVLLVVTMLK